MPSRFSFSLWSRFKEIRLDFPQSNHQSETREDNEYACLAYSEAQTNVDSGGVASSSNTRHVLWGWASLHLTVTEDFHHEEL